jgi:hypothetical protein
VTAIVAALAGTVIMAVIMMAITLARRPSGITTAQADAIEAGLA